MSISTFFVVALLACDCSLAYEHFGGGEVGEAACHAMNALVKLAGVETMITTFIEPLAELADSNSRVHCSLGLNTETGRLSARYASEIVAKRENLTICLHNT